MEGATRLAECQSTTQVPMGSIVVPFLGLPSRILNMNHKKELPWSLWVVHAECTPLRSDSYSGVHRQRRLPTWTVNAARAHSTHPIATLQTVIVAGSPTPEPTSLSCQFLQSSTATKAKTLFSKVDAAPPPLRLCNYPSFEDNKTGFLLRIF